MPLEIKPFDIAEHLNTPEDIRNFLQEVLDTGDESDFIHALSTAARAMGMTEVAKKAGVTRASQSRSREGPEKSQMDQGTPAGSPDKSWYGTGKTR